MINYTKIGEMVLHPTKRKILEALSNSDAPLSPNYLAGFIGEPLGNVSYHVNELAGRNERSRFRECPVLELVDTKPRRGALEHLYAVSREYR